VRSISHPRYKAKSKQTTPISEPHLLQLVAQIRAGCYSDLGCATQQQPMTDVQQKSSCSKVAEQKSATKVYVCHQGNVDVKPRLHDTTGYNQLYNRFDNRVELFIQPVVKPGCTTALTTGCIHDTAVCQTGCQTAVKRD